MESLGLDQKDENDENGGEEDSIKFEDGSQLIVVNCYPSCPEPELTLGMPPHSDYGFLTLLLQDEVEGLQIQHEGKWVTVEPRPNSFVVNVGDHLEVIISIVIFFLNTILVMTFFTRLDYEKKKTLLKEIMIEPHFPYMAKDGSNYLDCNAKII